MEKIAILTDSSAGFTKKELKENWYIVPLIINLEDETAIEDDEDVISNDKFYKLLEKQVLKTSQTPIGKMQEKWDELLKNYDKVICAFISKGLSSQFSNAYMLAQEEKYKNKIIMIDTDQVAEMLRYSVNKIDEYITNNNDLDNLQDYINKIKENFTTYIVPKSLHTLKRGGRISPAAAALATLLKITPILSFQGTIDKFDKTRTFKKAVEVALKNIIKRRKNREEISLIYSKIDPELLNTVREIIAKYGYIKINEYPIPNVVACHTGPNTISIICRDF